MIGLRHLVIAGASVAEPVIAAENMRMPLWAYFAVLALHAVASTGLVIHAFRVTARGR